MADWTTLPADQRVALDVLASELEPLIPPPEFRPAVDALCAHGLAKKLHEPGSVGYRGYEVTFLGRRVHAMLSAGPPGSISEESMG